MTRRLVLLDRAGLAATLLVPVFLTHGRGLAEAAIDGVAALFVVRSALVRDWSWVLRDGVRRDCARGGSVRGDWARFGVAWWGWLVVCSAIRLGDHQGLAGFGEALAVGRFLVFARALECWTLAGGAARRLMRGLLALALAYMAAQCVLQLLTGHNLFGAPRFSDGSLTGPYAHPRVAAPMSRLLFPVLLPVVAGLLAGRGGAARNWAARSCAALIGLAALALMVLVGQRMPLLLCLVGLLAVGLVERRLRPATIGLALALPVLVALSAAVSPPAFHHLWTVFSRQVAHFPSSAYGLIAARALAIVAAHPVTGLGFDAYRHHCADPAYFHGWFGDDGMGAFAGVCVQHPHNHYLQVAVDAGVPGLVLFALLVAAWIAAVARGLPARPDPLRTGLLAAVVMQEWPIASASDLVNLPLGGWFFLLLGFGLALARPISPPATTRSEET